MEEEPGDIQGNIREHDKQKQNGVYDREEKEEQPSVPPGGQRWPSQQIKEEKEVETQIKTKENFETDQEI